MRVGTCLFFQSYDDWDRYEAAERGEDVPGRPQIADHTIITEHMKMAVRAEEVGFDALWTVEHHVGPYTMVSNPTQMLSYVAGVTEKVDLGTMVIVLPWHNPLRVAEDIVLLDTLMGPDRKGMYGVGRGAGRREFKGLGVDMGESKGRFFEEVEVIKRALSEDRFSFEGEFYNFEDVELRPKPRDAQKILDELHISWISRSTVATAAPTGLKPMVIPQKGWDDYIEEIAEFNQLREEAGYEEARPIYGLTLYCAETEEEARAGAELYFREYGDSAVRNYELAGKHFSQVKGYEGYVELSKHFDGKEDLMGQLFMDNHIWGTPEQCIEKIKAFVELLRPQELIFFCRYGKMGHEESMKSMELFAKEVLPAVHEIPTPSGAVKVG